MNDLTVIKASVIVVVSRIGEVQFCFDTVFVD